MVGQRARGKVPAALLTTATEHATARSDGHGTCQPAKQDRRPRPMRIIGRCTRSGINDGNVCGFNDAAQCWLERFSVMTFGLAYPNLTGAWYDPVAPGVIGSLDKHGNPNVLPSTRNFMSSARTCAQTTLGRGREVTSAKCANHRL